MLFLILCAGLVWVAWHFDGRILRREREQQLLHERLERIEVAIDAIAGEVERQRLEGPRARHEIPPGA